jgi:hypothetical protein
MLDKEGLLGINQAQSEESVQEAIKRKRCGILDGINLDDPDSYIHREPLVEKAIAKARNSRLLIVRSPPGTGKTSLIQLVVQKLQQTTSNDNRSCTGFIVCPLRPEKQGFDLFDFVKAKTGVSYEDKTLTPELQTFAEVWLLFDDAQKLYGEGFNDFWEDVVKTRSQLPFGKQTKVIVVVSATYYLSTKSDSPVCFQCEPRIGIDDLLLSQSEASALFKLRSLYSEWQNYEAKLFYLTNGAAAAFAIGLNLIMSRSLRADYRTGQLSEDAMIEELIEGVEFLNQLRRCFPAKSVDADSHQIIFTAIVAAYSIDLGGFSATSVNAGNNPISKLKRAGILLDNSRFVSPVAARFYYSSLFPRASLDTEPPNSLELLVVQAVSSFSARCLRDACQTSAGGEKRTPKEAVFQQLFHEAISALLPASYRIIPELGTEALLDGKVVTGELDFYIRHGNKWALKLLRDGDNIGEHLGRIPGKYKNGVVDEWLVVDCRAHPSAPKKFDQNRCSLVFSTDYRSCQCYMRLSNTPTEIQLME